MSFTVFAPAKINLNLRVIRRREDGFHEIATTMARLGLADELTFRFDRSAEISISCNDATIPCGEENLIWRAMEAFRSVTGTAMGAQIELKKVIPSGAGLGGGSSDAAATLRLLNEKFDKPLKTERLLEVGAEIGSDVPFFLADCSWALATGRGEILSPMTEPLAAMECLLVKPPFGVATPSAYQKWAQSQELPGVNYQSTRVAGIEVFNDLERPVFQKYLMLADLRTWLESQSGVAVARMSGSGSTVFALGAPMLPNAELEEKIRMEFGNEMWIERTTLGSF